MTWLIDNAWDLWRKIDRFRRKRGPNDMDHYFPKVPALLELRPHECLWCRKIYPDEPKRGCPGNAK